MTAPDVYLVAAQAAADDLNNGSTAEWIASRSWFHAAVDAAVDCPLCAGPPPVRPIAILPPVVLKQAIRS